MIMLKRAQAGLLMFNGGSLIFDLNTHTHTQNDETSISAASSNSLCQVLQMVNFSSWSEN